MIDYLQNGKNRQRQAYSILADTQILQTLRTFDPILVGTIPINIAIEKSDLDIICHVENTEEFQ